MKQNKYDDEQFFKEYKKMPRSIYGLEGAGEWHTLRALLPTLKNADVLDLGCGFGWHCRYAREHEAKSVIGVDISENMLQVAREKTKDPSISYVKMPIEDFPFSSYNFDLVISSLALHYVQSFKEVCEKVYQSLKLSGQFIFSVEHPIFTSRNEQDWIYDDRGDRLHWAVDDYQMEGMRETSFLTDNVIKYHRTVSTYLNTLIELDFNILAVKEPRPSTEMLARDPAMKDELRRPMFLIIAAEKR